MRKALGNLLVLFLFCWFVVCPAVGCRPLDTLWALVVFYLSSRMSKSWPSVVLDCPGRWVEGGCWTLD